MLVTNPELRLTADGGASFVWNRDIEGAWCELQGRSYTRSIDAYLCFLSYYD